MTPFFFFRPTVRTALRRHWVPVALLLALSYPAANAVQPTTATKGPLPAAVARGSAKAGEQLARTGKPPSATACVSCHGAKGEGMAAFPPLAGTGFGYLLAQLDAFADGRRQNAVMGPIAKGLSPEERASTAAYFSGLPTRVRPIAAPPPAANDAGGWLAQRGRWADQLPACAQCHGTAGEGVGSQFPPIALLPTDYLQAQIQAWKDGTRPPGPLGVMRDIARKLSTEDVQALSAYYAQLHAKPASATPASQARQGAK
ncbi:MAG: c-type cytochrome [Polaromonas sp.]|uniref:c-type cytochrome n=1 Tax=Polaromonas sp. TaxID=1869339 RepID=UPI00272198F6|nr:c-type cytochrome [Polaromonas sp.]MDO9112757.1 c-type cytochrome [Polaromonas sp.]MDP1887831.1 c-type cytochrome [Polaromonas sp.]